MRRATVDDANSIARLEMVLFPDSCMNETTIANEIKDGECLVALDENDELLGYALVAVDGAIADVLRLGVHPDHQGHGIGSKLLNACSMCCCQTMLTVRKNNHGAFKLYCRFGFEIVGQLTSNDEQSWVLLHHNP